MTEDAKFEDGIDSPIYVGAMDKDDLSIVASLVQDAVFPIEDMIWEPKKRRFSLLLNRFRWEDAPAAERANRPYERVRSVLSFSCVMNVASQGIDRSDQDVILSVLSVEFLPNDGGSGEVHLHLAGDGTVRLTVEALEAFLRDVTRPYAALSGQRPQHDL